MRFRIVNKNYQTMAKEAQKVIFLRNDMQREIFLSAILGEVTTRSLNFIINKYSKPPVMAVEDSLQRALLRAQVIVDEAMGQHIRNQAMLLQLNKLRDAMHRGHYMLDTFRCKPHDDEDAEDHAVSRSSSQFIVNSAKRLCFSSKGAQASEELQEALDNLSSMILDVNELVLFLTSYPHLYCQPYSMHLQLANCMFGRQMEAELAITFLLHMEPHGSEEFKVLPIVGPRKVGKSTLVAHVCKDERVRDHFSEILFLRGHDFTDDELASFTERMEHQSRVSNSSKEKKLLAVVDLVGDLNEDAWDRLHSASKRSMPRGSKIILPPFLNSYHC